MADGRRQVLSCTMTIISISLAQKMQKDGRKKKFPDFPTVHVHVHVRQAVREAHRDVQKTLEIA